MNCKSLFSGKHEYKKKSIVNLSSAELAQGLVKVKNAFCARTCDDDISWQCARSFFLTVFRTCHNQRLVYDSKQTRLIWDDQV